MNLSGSRYLLLPLGAWAVAQASKVVLLSIKARRLDLRALASTGGMPSSHTAMAVALSTVMARYLGLRSPVFALAVIFSMVVMYDAAGVRRSAGRQAAVLNRLVTDLVALRGIREENLRELIGHTPMEIFVGSAIGILIGLIPI